MENTPKVTMVTKPNNQIKYKQNKVKINKLRAWELTLGEKKGLKKTGK